MRRKQGYLSQEQQQEHHSTPYRRPVPDVNFNVTREFWEGCKRHELLIQFCNSCNSYQFYPRASCVKCGSRGLTWQKSGGRGNIYSFTVIRQVVDNSPDFQRDIPFVIGLVELKEGVRIYSDIVGVPSENVKIGQEVEVFFENLSPEVTLPKFKIRTDSDVS